MKILKISLRFRVCQFLLTAVALILLLPLTSCSSAEKEEPVPVHNATAIGFYTDFISNIQSGQITKTHFNDSSLYEMMSFTTEKVQFAMVRSPAAQGSDSTMKKRLTYVQRQPLVFWHYPDPNYYDGDFYYYKHGNDWFIDTFNRYKEHLELDCMGIPPEFLQEYLITENSVLSQGENYYIRIRSYDPADPKRTVQIEGTANGEKVFSRIDITVSFPHSKEEGKTAREFYRIRYSQINEPLQIEPPKTLTEETMAYLQEEYRQEWPLNTAALL